MQDVANFISTVGFPVFVAVYVLIRQEATLKKIEKAINRMTLVIAATLDVDISEVDRLANGGGGQ